MASTSNGNITVTANAALEPNRLVRLVASGAVYADATNVADAVTKGRSLAAGEQILVTPLTCAALHEVSCSGTLAAGAIAYQAANGQVANSGTVKFGRAHPDVAAGAANQTSLLVYNPNAN